MNIRERFIEILGEYCWILLIIIVGIGYFFTDIPIFKHIIYYIIYFVGFVFWPQVYKRLSMKANKNKNIAIVISATFLFLAMFSGWPYGFFTLLHLIVFGTTTYLTWSAYRSEKQTWIWIFGFIALVFNPLIPLHLGRDLWMWVDLLVAVFLIISIFAFKLPKEL